MFGFNKIKDLELWLSLICREIAKREAV